MVKSSDDIVKPKTKRGKRALEQREAKINENAKKALFLRGTKTSEVVSQAMKDWLQLKKPFAISYQKRNEIRPFEDQTSLEFFSKKSDASLFVFGNHTKKRPHNLILGRMYDYHLLDMFELGITQFQALRNFKGIKSTLGCKPCLIFAGEAFETQTDYIRLKHMLLDFFRGPKVDNIRLNGLEHVIHITALKEKILFRCYKVLLKKSGTKTPRVELQEMGPSIDFELRRTKLGSEELLKEARKVPRVLKPKKEKNISHDTFGAKLGRVHIQSQNLSSIQTRKMKALKRKKEKDVASVDAKKAKSAATE
ncbi:uncharacterized protein TRIADDRAFT_56868 [Trichoplax adhaerens]|uniref:Ribosome production factor 2 homolog n=1 Tax=Trichoplax adhaerens TaxID=10228 RepID=B3RWT3_TRIAD|nr:hypothetical protein TRIADDRAFT_56868 [Trichoplax adhaerens]EDV24757.1 hypothetical protein TRIADDRAFT_56868 [Trichoplax adhaerens]|eukprot:XP_002112647.1 hypothetical protein TRIADDRAFT_56868 [Trichoplax adhaerens]